MPLGVDLGEVGGVDAALAHELGVHLGADDLGFPLELVDVRVVHLLVGERPQGQPEQ